MQVFVFLLDTDTDWVSEFKVNKSVVGITLSMSSESAAEK